MKGQVLKLEENKNNIIMDSQGVLNRNQLNQIELTTHMDNSLTSRLMNTKIVRIHPGSICACVTGYRKMIFNITTISKRDDKERANENETPLFYAEENLICSCLCFCDCRPFQITFELFDPNTKQLFSTCQIKERDTLVDECCKDPYTILAPIYNYKVNNRNDESMVSRYDTRSVYRTYDYLGQRYYKIGKPYVEGKEPPCCDKCLLCCSKSLFVVALLLVFPMKKNHQVNVVIVTVVGVVVIVKEILLVVVVYMVILFVFVVGVFIVVVNAKIKKEK